MKETLPPFVRRNVPFVCKSGGLTRPYISKNKPFVGFANYLGFTLTEFVMTIAIAAILMGIAVPSIGRFLESSSLVTVTNDLIADINAARGEAIKRGFSTVVCESSDGTACTATGNWRAGWMVFIDSTNNSAFDVGSGEVRVRFHEATSGNHNITGGRNILTFSRMGLLTGGATVYRICNTKIDSFRDLTIGTTGRASITGTGSC